MFSLDGKTAIVTGGTSGIGLGIAQALLDAGARVAVWSRSAAWDRLPDALRSWGPDRVLAVACDVAVEEHVERAFAETLAAMPEIDVVVSCAGVSPPRARFEEYPTELWRSTMATNLDGTFFTFRAASRHLLERGRAGSMIAIGSLVVDAGFAQRESYAASKNGVIGVVRSIAVEYGKHGIRANAILPGWIETPLMDSVVEKDGAQSAGMPTAVLRRIPMRRFGTPDELAGIAVYLASDASRYHSGDCIRVDGGYSVM